MKCLRYYVTEVETGRSLRKIRVPLAVIRIVAQLLPPRVFELIKMDGEVGIDGEVGKETVNAIYKMLLEVDKKRDEEIENGLIVEMEEYNEEFKRLEYSVIFVE